MLVSIDKSTGAGTVIGSIGFDANFGQGMGWDAATDTLYMAAFNGGAFQAELRAVDRTTGNTTLIGVLGATTPGGLTQVPWLGFELGGGDALWLDEDPISGTLDAGAWMPVDILFDATVITQTGTYTAEISFDGTYDNDPAPIQVVMHVVDTATYGVDVGPDSAAEAQAGTTMTYTVWVTNTGDVSDAYDLSVSGAAWNTTLSDASVTLNAGEAVAVTVWVDVPASASGGEMDVAAVTATSQSDGSVSDSATLTTTVPTMGVYLPIVINE